MSLDRSAPARTPSRSARCTVRLGAPSVAVIALIHARNLPAALPGTYDREFRFPPDRIDLVLEAERAQRLDGVRHNPDPGADLAEPGRLFAENDFGVLPLQRQSRGKSADAAADENARHPQHAFLPCRSNADRAERRERLVRSSPPADPRRRLLDRPVVSFGMDCGAGVHRG